MHTSSIWLVLALCAGLPSTSALLAARLPPCRLHSLSRCGSRIVCCSEAMGDEGVEAGEDAVEEDGEATVYARKKGKYVKKQVDNRDRLPYELTDITPPERKIGTYQLAPNLGCGDGETPPETCPPPLHSTSAHVTLLTRACGSQWWIRPRTRSRSRKSRTATPTAQAATA